MLTIWFAFSTLSLRSEILRSTSARASCCMPIRKKLSKARMPPVARQTMMSFSFLSFDSLFIGQNSLFEGAFQLKTDELGRRIDRVRRIVLRFEKAIF